MKTDLRDFERTQQGEEKEFRGFENTWPSSVQKMSSVEEQSKWRHFRRGDSESTTYCCKFSLKNKLSSSSVVIVFLCFMRFDILLSYLQVVSRIIRGLFSEIKRPTLMHDQILIYCLDSFNGILKLLHIFKLFRLVRLLAIFIFNRIFSLVLFPQVEVPLLSLYFLFPYNSLTFNELILPERVAEAISFDFSI